MAAFGEFSNFNDYHIQLAEELRRCKQDNERLVNENKRLLNENTQMHMSIMRLSKQLKTNYEAGSSTSSSSTSMDIIEYNNQPPPAGFDINTYADNDILYEIFRWLAPMRAWEFTSHQDVVEHQQRTILMQVCKNWLNTIRDNMNSWAAPGNSDILANFTYDKYCDMVNSYSISVNNIVHLKLRDKGDNLFCLNDNIVNFFVEHCDRLVTIDLWNCPGVTNQSLKGLADKHGESMTSLSVSMCNTISDEGIEYICKKCPNLTTLNVADLYKLTDKAASAIASLAKLQNIDLTVTNAMNYRMGEPYSWACIYCSHFNNKHDSELDCMQCASPRYSRITEAGLLQIASKSTLKSVSFRGHANVTSVVARVLAKHSSQTLEKLDVSWCSLNFEDIEEIAKTCRKLWYLHASRLNRTLDYNHLTQLEQLFPQCMEKYAKDYLKFDAGDLGVGDRTMVLDTVDKWYPARVLARKTEPSTGVPVLLIHYDGWSKKWDEWIKIDMFGGGNRRIKPVPYLWCAGNIMRGL